VNCHSNTFRDTQLTDNIYSCHEHLPVCVCRQQSPASATFHPDGLHAAFAGSVGTERPYTKHNHLVYILTCDKDKSNTQINTDADNNVAIMMECKHATQAANLIADVANI